MASARALARLETLIWVLVYGGLLAAVLGIAFHQQTDGDAHGALTLMIGGSVVAAVGFALIYVRSRLKED